MDDLKIKGHDNLLKRNKSSVINTDDEAYLAAKKRAKNKDILEKKANAPWWRPNTLGPNMKLAKKTPEQLDRYIKEGK
jgi:hypothetical protein